MFDNHEAVKVVEESGEAEVHDRLSGSSEWFGEGADEHQRMRETVDGSHRSWMRTGTPSARPLSKASRVNDGRPCISVQGAVRSGHISEIWRKQEGQGALVLERSMTHRDRFLRSGQCAEDSNKISW